MARLQAAVDSISPKLPSLFFVINSPPPTAISALHRPAMRLNFSSRAIHHCAMPSIAIMPMMAIFAPPTTPHSSVVIMTSG